MLTPIISDAPTLSRHKQPSSVARPYLSAVWPKMSLENLRDSLHNRTAEVLTEVGKGTLTARRLRSPEVLPDWAWKVP